MRVKRRIQDSAPREFVEIGPDVAVRMPLAQEPSAATVGTYVLTRGASPRVGGDQQSSGGNCGRALLDCRTGGRR